jgi:DNA-binding Xre family transcriptional regulator
MIKPRLRELLESRGKSLYWLARETETDYKALWMLRASRTQGITFAVLDRVCTALGCAPGDVLVQIEGQPARKRAAKKGDKK